MDVRYIIQYRKPGAEWQDSVLRSFTHEAGAVEALEGVLGQPTRTVDVRLVKRTTTVTEEVVG